MIEIRPARSSDVEDIASLSAEVQAHHAKALPQLFKPAGPATFPPDAVRKLLDHPDWIILLACVGTTVVGYATAELQRRAETSMRHASVSLCVQFMGVRAAWRRQSAGRALIAAMRDAASARGATSLVLDVWDFNSDAYAFYRAVGFHPIRHILAQEIDTGVELPNPPSV